MLSRRLRERCPSAEALGVARLPGFELRFDKRSWKDGSGKCHVRRADERAGVWGVLYQLDAADRPALDREEGLGKGYEAVPVLVAAGEHGTVSAFTYLAESGFVDDSLLPFDWYHELVVAGAEEHSLPKGYVRALLDVASQPDPNLGRAATARRLLAPRQAP